MAHDCVHKSQISQGVILICTPDLYIQEFKFSGTQLKGYKHEFLKRLDSYYDLKHDEKESVSINTKELLEEFEQNKI